MNFLSNAPRPEHEAVGRHPGEAVIRPVTEADLADIERVDRAVFGEAAYPAFVVRQLFDVHGHHMLALDTPTGLRGYVLLATARGWDTAWILSLGVEEPWRQKGYGRRLLSQCVRDMADRDLREIRLSVEPGNDAAVQLYRSLGFVPVVTREDYLGPGEDRLIMALPVPRAAPGR
ncbi:GNAT family N-acetyltransferase [Actinacidiphila acidipaludis]|uniref:GNAT family N-acetyltransferase n=1 Tax=Actinacidiphila acidipaludis TaxID=2873382 RepID=A0ABS7Q9B3_9ACTN|nr:GNAT family N-acetyltransferase [Streptomyces acidipaludis]MBY8879030.1 GNAT family N-acetyltransferase [Streptomyces acidipaludis]